MIRTPVYSQKKNQGDQDMSMELRQELKNLQQKLLRIKEYL